MKMQRRTTWILTGFLVCLAAVVLNGRAVTSAQETKAADEKTVYELRTYTANDGKFEDLHNRFRNHTMKLFEKVGMKNIAYWTDIDKKNTLVYIVAHKNKKAGEDSWKRFIEDPEWKEAYAASIENGRLVKKITRQWLKSTDYSPMK